MNAASASRISHARVFPLNCMILVPVLMHFDIGVTLKECIELLTGQHAGSVIASGLLPLRDCACGQYLERSAWCALRLSESLSRQPTLNMQNRERLTILTASRLTRLRIENGISLSVPYHGIVCYLRLGGSSSGRLSTSLRRLLRGRGDWFCVGERDFSRFIRNLVCLRHDTILQQKSPGYFAEAIL